MLSVTTLDEEKKKLIKEGVEKMIFHTNKILNSWANMQGKTDMVSNTDSIRSVFRGNIRKYLTGLVDMRALSSFEYSVVIVPATTPYISDIGVYSVRSGIYNRYGSLEKSLNEVFHTINYQALKYTVAKEESLREAEADKYKQLAVLAKVEKQTSIIDFEKLSKFSF